MTNPDADKKPYFGSLSIPLLIGMLLALPLAI